MANRPEILWCPKGTGGASGKSGWRFPRNVERLLRAATFCRSTLHLFGGLAAWGVCLDIDPLTRPHVVGDAWLPPFAHHSFDVVILDPPYMSIPVEVKLGLFYAAAFIARESIWWFSTMWVGQPPGLRLVESWLVRAGENAQVRALQHFIPTREFGRPTPMTRGPARKYLHWMSAESAKSAATAPRSQVSGPRSGYE